MKKLFLILNFFISFFLFASQTEAQTLSLDSISGFPDSVNNGQQVSMTLWLSVNGFVFQGDLAILMNSVNHDNTPDTLYYNPSDSVGANGVETLQIVHTFSAAELDGGDNIVVVWPASANGSVNPDSITFQHLVLRNVGISENEKTQVVELYPSPVYDFLRLRMSHPEKVEQVRVLDVLGKELLRFDSAVTRFNISSLNSGVYFVEVLNKDHSKVVKKFFRE